MIKLKRVRPEALMPAYATAGASGLDLHAAFGGTVLPGHPLLIPTGWAIEIPSGWEGQVRPRSGMASRQQVATIFGTIDCDYRGEISVLLVYFGTDSYSFSAGDRIAQLVIAPVIRTPIMVVAELSPSARGASGFGSTGR
jgi:dUTP pyrophosphatase